MTKTGTDTISIGDLVGVKSKIKILTFDDISLEVEIMNGTDNQKITVPRFISALGQYLPGQNWIIPPGDYELSDNFQITGRYAKNKELFQAKEMTQEENDGFLQSYIDETIDGSILHGRVIFIYSIFMYGVDPMQDEIMFFDNVKTASLDHHAIETYCVIQDLGSDIEYPLDFRLLYKF